MNIAEVPHGIIFAPIVASENPALGWGGGTAPEEAYYEGFKSWLAELQKPRYEATGADHALVTLPDFATDYDAEDIDRLQSQYFRFLNNFWRSEHATLYDLDKSKVINQEPISNLQSTFQRLEVGVEEGTPVVVTFGTRPGDNQRLNEDSLLISSFGKKRHLFTVFDGASSQKAIVGLQRFDWAGAPVTGAFYVSHVASLEFPFSREYQELASNPSASANDFIHGLNTWLRERLGRVEGVNYEDVLTIPGMCATSIVVDQEKGIVTGAHVADSIAIAKIRNPHTGQIEYKVLTDNKNKRFDDKTMELIAQIAAADGISIREAAVHPAVKDQLKASYREKINTPTGTGIVNGMPELVDNGLIQTFELDLDSLEYLVIATDGFYTPWMHFIDSEITEEEKVRLFEDMFARISEMSTEGWTGEITDDPTGIAHGILENDPDHNIIPRIKPRDDGTFIGINFAKMKEKEIPQAV